MKRTIRKTAKKVAKKVANKVGRKNRKKPGKKTAVAAGIAAGVAVAGYGVKKLVDRKKAATNNERGKKGAKKTARKRSAS